MSLFQTFIYKLARKGLENNVFMSTYVLISKCHIQARAKRLRTKMFLCQHMSLFQNFIYKLARKGLETNVFMSTYVLISKFHIQAPKTGEWWEGKGGGEGREGEGLE